MTTNEKLKIISDKLCLLNDTVFKNKKWKLGFKNKGTNDYCLVIGGVGSFSFATYGSVISALTMLEEMFDKAINEKGGK